jgi:arylsulfatase A-like enzyme
VATAAAERSRRAFLLAVLGLAILSGAAACRARERPPRLVLLYATCSLNKQYLAPYDPTVGYTPVLRALQKRSVVFERHRAEAGHSGVDFAALFSGSQADRHGVFFHPKKLSDDLVLVSEVFAAGGYETWFWGGHPMASPSLNYAQGVPPERALDHRLVAGDPEWKKLLQKLRADRNARAFVTTNFSVTHPPYPDDYVRGFCDLHPAECKDVPWDRYASIRDVLYSGRLSYDFAGAVAHYKLTPEVVTDIARVAEVLYKSDVWHLDHMFGELVAEIDAEGLLPETLIAFTSDHGEVLFDEAAPFKWTHGYQLTTMDLGIPLLLIGPGLRPGAYAETTRSIDVAPTLAGLAGLAPPAGAMQGIDLSPVLRGAAPPVHNAAFSHTMLLNELIAADQPNTLLGRLFKPEDVDGMWVAAREGDRTYKLARRDGTTWTEEAYDLAADPHEARNVYDPRSPRDQAAMAELRRYKERLTAAYRHGSTAADPSREEQIERLRSLGYIK